LSSLINSFSFSIQSISLKNINDFLEKGYISAKKLIFLIDNNNILIITVILSSLITNFLMYLFLFNFISSYGFLEKIVISILGLSVILFSNILFRFYSSKNPDKFTLNLSFFINTLFHILYPISYFINKLFYNKILSISDNLLCFKKEFNEEQIKDLVEIGEEAGMLEDYETKIINSALNIDKITVESIITPRVDVKCVQIDTTVHDALELMLSEEYSRIPVYEDNIDNITGILHIKDLFKAVRDNKDNENKSVKFFMRDAFHVPESKLIIDLLKEMQLKGIQMVIVSDEFGGTAGIVTMEDILEEIVGEIRDEHDIDEEPNIIEIDNNTLIVNPMVSISDINDKLDIDIPNSQSVSKFIIDTIGDLPNVNQEIVLEDIIIKVLELDGKRIQKVLIRKKSKVEKEAKNEISSTLKL